MNAHLLKALLVSIALLFSSLSNAQRGERCLNLYDGYFNCTANSFMTNSPECKRAIQSWQASPDCLESICNMPSMNGSSPPYLNCGVNQERYQSCINSGFGKGRPYASPEQFCKQWAGPGV